MVHVYGSEEVPLLSMCKLSHVHVRDHYTLSTCLPITVLIVVLAKNVHIVVFPLILIAHCGVHSMAHTETGPYKDLISVLSHYYTPELFGGGAM